jgi:hypothetical protein
MLETRKGTTFIRLPLSLQRPIADCQCPYCKGHPANPPMWDTLATDGETSWTVHYPELSNRKA